MQPLCPDLVVAMKTRAVIWGIKVICNNTDYNNSNEIRRQTFLVSVPLAKQNRRRHPLHTVPVKMEDAKEDSWIQPPSTLLALFLQRNVNAEIYIREIREFHLIVRQGEEDPPPPTPPHERQVCASDSQIKINLNTLRVPSPFSRFAYANEGQTLNKFTSHIHEATLLDLGRLRYQSSSLELILEH